MYLCPVSTYWKFILYVSSSIKYILLKSLDIQFVSNGVKSIWCHAKKLANPINQKTGLEHLTDTQNITGSIASFHHLLLLHMSLICYCYKNFKNLADIWCLENMFNILNFDLHIYFPQNKIHQAYLSSVSIYLVLLDDSFNAKAKTAKN